MKQYRQRVFRPWFVFMLLLVGRASAQTPVERVITGTISDDKSLDIIPLDVPRDGSNIIIDMRPPADQIETSELDTYLYLLDGNNRIIAENDDAARGAVNSLIEYPLASSGTYRIVATRYGLNEGRSTGDYEVTVQVVPTEPALIETTDTSDEALQAAGFPATTAREEAIWTVLVYYGADNNLEPAILADLNEFELGGGSNESVRVVALVDNESAEGTDQWSTARLFEVKRDTSNDIAVNYPPTIDSPYLSDLGEINTSGASAFEQFLVWGVRNFPAQNYALAIGSHGAGWHGLVTDDTTFRETQERVILSIPRLQSGMRAALAAAGVDEFQFLINDACLMASVEYHLAMSEFFRYSLASPEIVVNPAHDMTQFLRTLKNNTSVDLRSVGRGLISTYIERDVLGRATSDGVYLSSVLTDLSNYGDIRTALNNFADVFNTDPTLYTSILNEARRTAYVYSAYVGGEELIDLGNLMQTIVRQADDPNIVVAAQAVLVALRRATLYAEGGSRIRESVSHYQNIFFPETSSFFSNNSGKYFAESGLGQWGAMLRSYFNELTPQVFTLGNERSIAFHPPMIPMISVFGQFPPQIALDAHGATLGMDTAIAIPVEIVGRNLNAAYYTFEKIERDAEGVEQFVRYSEELVLSDVPSGVAIARSTWDATLPYILFGDEGGFDLLRLSGADRSTGTRVASLEGRYREDGSDIWNDVSIVFDATNISSGGAFQRVVNRSAETGAAADVTIPVGAIFQTTRLVLEDGKIIRTEGNTYRWPEGGPTWEWQPAPDGDYNITVTVTTSGGSGTFSRRVALSNANANLSLRADAVSGLHVSIERPREWSAMNVTVLPGDIRAFRSSSPDGKQNFTIYYRFFSRHPELFADGAIPLADTLPVFTENGQLYGYDRIEITKAPVDITIDGRPALEIEYRYTEEGLNYIGRGYLVYQSTDFGDSVMLVGAESQQGRVQHYDLLRDDARFWDFSDANPDDNVVETDADGQPIEGEWRGQPQFVQRSSDDEITVYDLLGGTEYFVPIPYGSGAVETINDTLWATYYQNNDPTSGTFLRVTAAGGAAPENPAAYITDYLSNNVGIPAQLVDSRRYRGKYFTWFAATYRGERDGSAVYGRFYITPVQSGSDSFNILFWFETPFGDDIERVRTIVGQELEPVIDSFKLP